jgi:hypothetical protein
MHILNYFYPALLAASGASALRSGAKVKLSSVQSLTLRKDLQTSHRRVSALPQVILPENILNAPTNPFTSSNASAAPHAGTMKST